MAYWDNERQLIRHTIPTAYPNYPGWLLIDCGCCKGFEWGGQEPRECNSCCGSGYYAKHKKSGIHAQYPGGPFC